MQGKLTRNFAMTFAGLVLAATMMPVLQAQTAVDGAIAGTVEDASGAAIPKASVEVHNGATNADIKLTADEAGYFRVPRLTPGVYTITVTEAGFSSYQATRVTVEVGKLTEVSPKLNAGGTTTVVDVSSDTPIMNTESSDYSVEFNAEQLATLPINGRHWTSFALLSPGVTLGNSAFGQVSFRGTSNLQNNFLVDGVDDNDAFQSVERGYTRVGYSTPQDAILEFQVNTSNYSVQYGRAVGGGVNAVTRSGSNTFHGDLFEYYRDNDFGATNPFSTLAVTNPVTGAFQTIYIKPKDKRHQYGGTFSGPLMKDRLFFLYAFDQQKRNFPIVAVPTPQFLSYSNAAYNNCAKLGGGTVDAVTCALNRGVPQAQITAAENYIAGQSGIAPRQGDQILNFMKLDYRLNDKNSIALIYNRMRWDSNNGIQTNPVIRRGLTSIGNDYDKVDSAIGKITTAVSPKISNELRFGYAREFDNENGDTPQANEPTTTAGGLPPGAIVSTNSGFSLGTPYYIPRTKYPDEREIQGGDNVTWVLGGHTLNIGADYHWIQDNIIDVDYLHGLFTYSRVADFFTDFARAAGTPVSCDAARDSGVGSGLPCYSTLQQAFGRAQFVYHTNEFAGYAQDDWKVAQHVTLNLGVRYDFEKLPKAKIPNANIPLTGSLPSDQNNIAPRVGFAWDIFGTGKTVAHGGFGLYYGRIENGVIFRALAATASANGQFQLSSSGTLAASPVYPFLVPTATAPAISNVQAFAPHFQNPLSDEIDVSIQQDLGYKTVLTIAYLGSLGKQLPNLIDTNIAPATTTKTYTFSGGPLAGDQWTVPVYNARLSTVANAITQITSNVNSNYHALALSVDHRLMQGVQLSASYVWSKSLDYNMNQNALPTETNDPTDPFTIKPDYAYSVNNIPQRFTGNLTLSPKFAIANHTLSYLANGFLVAPTWVVQSGVPYNYGLSSGTSVAGSSASSFNGSGGLNLVNFSAYRNLGNNALLPGIRRSSARQANIDDVDMRISRSFSFLTKYKLTLAGEAFNLLNRENFTAYNTTAYTLSGTTATYQASFGTPSAAGNTIIRERQIQFVGRFEF
jgi:hypothetical protein